MNYYNYFTEVEEHFVRRRGKHMFVSPLDWSLIATWRDTGIPLHVAIRGIDIAMDGFFARPLRQERVNTLFFCHDSVMEEYARFLQARVGESHQPSGSETPPSVPEPGGESAEPVERGRVLAFLAARKSEINGLIEKLSIRLESSVREGLQRICDRLLELAESLEQESRFDPEPLERDLGILEESLVAELRRLVPEAEQAGWTDEAKKELRVYRKRLPKETYQKILHNYINGKLHRSFDIGELSLFHL